jgi:hypothetical protein
MTDKGQLKGFISQIFTKDELEDEIYWVTPRSVDYGYKLTGRYSVYGDRFYVTYKKFSPEGCEVLNKASFLPEKDITYKFSVENNKIIITSDEASVNGLKYYEIKDI